MNRPCSYQRIWRLLAGLLLIWARGTAQNPARLSRQAAELLQAGNAEQAIALLKKAIAQEPKFFPAYSLLGVSYSQLGKLEQARTFFEKAVQLAPDSTQARNNLGANYLALKKPAEAAAQFEKVIAADAKNLTAWVNLANSQLQMGEAAQALRSLERAQELAPDDPEVQLALGRLLAKDGRGSEALQYFRQLRDHDPNAVANLMALAEKSMEEADYKTALSLLTAVEDSQQSSSRWHEMVGYAHSKLDHAEPALRHLQKAIQLEPTNEDYYLTLAEFLGNNNATDAIVTLLEAAVKILPRSIKIQSALGLAYVMIGDVDKAESALKKVVETHPDYEVGYKLLGDCYNRAQDWNKLKAVAAELRKINEKNSSGWYYGAIAEYHLLKSQGGESLETIRQYTTRALKLDPNDWRSQILLGRLLLDKKKNDEAVAAFRKAITINDAEPSSHYLLARTLRQLGRTEESKLAFNAFQEARANEKARKFRTLLVDIQRQR